MSLDRHAQRLLTMLSLAGARAAAPTLAERRAGLEALRAMAEDEPLAQVVARDHPIAGPGGALVVRVYRPKDAAARAPGLIFLHGGGWVAGGLETHDGLCRRLAAASGTLILAVDYRLAPDHRFPAPIEDGLAAYLWAVAQAEALGLDPERIGLGGDSVGGGIAAAVAAGLGQDDAPRPALLLLICPVLDLAHESASRLALAEGYFLDRATLMADLADYLPSGADPADPRASPLLAADVAGLPPVLIHTAEYDPFRDEAMAYAARLGAAGVAAEITEHPGMIHYFYALPRAIPHARTAAAAMGVQVAARLTSCRLAPHDGAGEQPCSRRL